ncbi:Hypothetical protein D9617_2g053930 [Elsinoe fawcettii]|nr:Hypothetical protein D9617_2g053930 [Elsinoe fawcettii]
MHSVILFVDALDECNASPSIIREVGIYLYDLCDVTKDSEYPISVLVSCRPWPEVMVKHDYFVVMDECNSDDVRAAISHRLKIKDIPSSEISRIGKRIEDKALGVMQWVLLVAARIVDGYIQGLDEDAIIKVIDEAPQELYDIYEQLFGTLSTHEARQAQPIMQWLCYCRTALTLDDLRTALVMDSDQLPSTISACIRLHNGCVDAERMGRRAKLLSRGLVEARLKNGQRYVQ